MGVLLAGVNAILLLYSMFNLHSLPAQYIFYGEFSNFVVFSTNGFMPSYVPGGKQNEKLYDGLYVQNPDSANFPFLGDWICVFTPMGYLDFSPGDVLIGIGLGILSYQWWQSQVQNK